jgi:hypothetical protein
LLMRRQTRWNWNKEIQTQHLNNHNSSSSKKRRT